MLPDAGVRKPFLKENNVARYLGPKGKLSRREGTDLFLKSARRPIGDKVKFDSKPGQHGRTSGSRTSDYGLQLREKQKVKRMYGVLEKQFRQLLRRSRAPQGQHRRQPADRCSNRAWTTSSTAWASARRAPKRARWSRTRRSRSTAPSVNIPSFLVKAGDVVAVREKSKKQLRIVDALKLADSIGLPAWVSVDLAKQEGIFKKAPDRDEFGAEINESMIVELYSR